MSEDLSALQKAIDDIDALFDTAANQRLSGPREAVKTILRSHIKEHPRCDEPKCGHFRTGMLCNICLMDNSKVRHGDYCNYHTELDEGEKT